MKKSQKKGIKKILRIAIGALITFVFAVLLYIVIMLLMGKPVYFFGYSIVKIETKSMYIEGDSSSFAVDDFIIIKKIKASEVKEGDVITFYSDDLFIAGAMNTHRVVSVLTNPDGSIEFVTKGDNNTTNPINDFATAKEDKLIGVYIGEKAGFLKSVYKLFSNKEVFILLIFIPALIIMSFTTRDLLKSFKVKKPEETPTPLTAEELIAIEVERLKKEGLPKDFGKTCESDDNNSNES